MIQSGTFTKDGTTPVDFPVQPTRATPLTLYGIGTFGGGTLSVLVTPDGNPANATALTSVTLTSNGYVQLPLIQGGFIVKLAGSTSPSLAWWLQ